MGILRHADIRETLIYAPYEPEEGLKAIKWMDMLNWSADTTEGKIRENLTGK